MNKWVHKVYIGSMVLITASIAIYLGFAGYSYYSLPLEERFYHPQHDWFKPSGIFGHGLGIMGTFLIFFGVTIYIARKRYGFLARFIRLKYLLEFHIFLCVLGPIMILFHTSFKFGGIVSVAFWSMVAVVLSGVIGRFIYIQIPRTIEGRELSLQELKSIRSEMTEELKQKTALSADYLENLIETVKEERSTVGVANILQRYWEDRKTIRDIRKQLKEKNIDRKERTQIVKTIRKEISLDNKIKRLHTMQRLFKYWHVAHLPFALIMLIIVILHVGVTLAFGYKWIF